MAQYLDNDEDGIVDNPFLLKTLIENKCNIYVEKGISSQYKRQDLGADESHPEWHINGHMVLLMPP